MIIQSMISGAIPGQTRAEQVMIGIENNIYDNESILQNISTGFEPDNGFLPL